MTLARFRYFVLLLFLGVPILSVVGYHEIQKRLAQPSVKAFLEAKASEVLNADLQIGKTSFKPPFGMSLEQIQINRREGASYFSVASLEKLVFSYGPLNLIRRDFNFPTSFRLERPRIDFRSTHTPLPFVSPSAVSDKLPASLEIRGGEFHYPWGTEGKKVFLTDVHFKAKPDARGQIHIVLKSKLEGMASGALEIHGLTDPQFRHYQLEVEMIDVAFSSESQIPIRKLSSHFYMSEKTIRVETITSLFHDWEFKGVGQIEDWQTRPKIFFDFTRKKAQPPFQFSLRMDFEAGSVRGEWSWAGHPYPFKGKMAKEGKKILFSDLQLPRGYQGQGEIDHINGDYEFSFEREKRRFRIQSNWSRLAFETQFQLDHASIDNLDWVVLGKARFTPLPKRSGDKGPRFLGEISTDYLVLEFEPLNNFHGTFELNAEGIQAIDFKWGGVFQLGGGILFRGGKPKEDLVLRVEGFPLDHVRDFAGRPIPSNLSGNLEGKLKFRGLLAHPEIQGYFTISEGTIDKLKFDHAVIQFQGFPPYLKIYDSNIFRGRNTLQLTGAINLTLQNIFHGIQIRGPDHLVIWKGMSVYWEKDKSAIEAEKSLGGQMAMGLEVGTGVDTKGEDPEESHAVFGPKLKF